MRICLLGYYGYGNLGDDIILGVLARRLAEMSSVSRVNVLVRDDTYSSDPVYNLDKVRYVPTRRLRDKMTKYRLFMDSDFFVWGGGTCLYEPESGDIRGMVSFLRNTRLFRLAGKPYGFLGIGMGPLRSARATRVTSRILNHASFVTFRDSASMGIARGVTEPRLWERFERCGDPFLLSMDRLRALCKPRQTNAVKKIAFCGHAGLARQESLVRFYADQMTRLMQETGASVSCIPMQTGRDLDDNRFHRAMKRHVRPSDRFHVHLQPSLESLVSVLKDADFLIGMRLHSLVLADVLSIPNLGIETLPKVGFYLDAFPTSCPRRAYPLMTSFSPEEVLELAAAYSKARDELEQTLTDLRRGAEKNFPVLEAALAKAAGPPPTA